MEPNWDNGKVYFLALQFYVTIVTNTLKREYQITMEYFIAKKVHNETLRMSRIRTFLDKKKATWKIALRTKENNALDFAAYSTPQFFDKMQLRHANF